MRRYIDTNQLSQALQALVYDKNPQFLKVYAQLYCYKQDPNNKNLKCIERMLAAPRKYFTAILNVVLAITAGILLFAVKDFPQIIFWRMPLCAVIVLFSSWFLFGIVRYRPLYKRCTPYILIDELMERGIITLKKDAKKKRA